MAHYVHKCMLLKACEILETPAAPYTDPIITEVGEAAEKDDTYKSSIYHISTGFPANQKDLPATLRDFWKLSDDLSTEDGLVLFGSRLVVPASLRHRGNETSTPSDGVVAWNLQQHH